MLDYEMLAASGTRVLDALREREDEDNLPRRSGAAVAGELVGRYLLRYVATDNERVLATRGKVYLTPTPYSSDEAREWLGVPAPSRSRLWVVILRPAAIPWLQGPLWVFGGGGIQYILPDGYPREAVVVPGAPSGRWVSPVS